MSYVNDYRGLDSDRAAYIDSLPSPAYDFFVFMDGLGLRFNKLPYALGVGNIMHTLLADILRGQAYQETKMEYYMARYTIISDKL